MAEKSLTINNLEFAKKAMMLEGALPIANLPRLSEWLVTLNATEGAKPAAAQGDLHYKLQGDTNAAGQHFLHLDIDVDTSLLCQRCFKSMAVAESLSYEYLLTPKDEADILNESMDIDEDYDLLTEDREMSLQALMVDEVIAAMPYAPMHAHDCTDVKAEVGSKPNPFAVLEALKK